MCRSRRTALPPNFEAGQPVLRGVPQMSAGAAYAPGSPPDLNASSPGCYSGPVMATMITSECINCGACEPECPNTAIYQGGVEWQAQDGAMHPALSNDI